MYLSPRKVSLRVPEVSLSVTKSPTTFCGIRVEDNMRVEASRFWKKSPVWILLSWALLARKWEDLHHSDKEGWIICSHSRFPKQSEARADQVKADSEEQPECEADVDGDEEGEEEEENAQTHPRGGDLASHLKNISKQDGIAKQLIKKQTLPPPPTYWPSSSLPRQASWTFPSTCSCSPFHSRSLFLLTL